MNKYFPTFASAIVSSLFLTQQAIAAPVTVKYSIHGQQSGQTITAEQQFDSETGSGAWFSGLPSGAILVQVVASNALFNSKSGKGELSFQMNVLNSSDESIEIDSEVSVALSSGLAKPILGGHVRFFGYLTDETLPREAALLVDETTLPGSEVGESALSSCGEGCAMALFGNGQPSIPAPAASASIGYRSKMEISPASALGSSVAKVSVANTALCADFNGDRKVDSADLGIILGAFGPANNSLDINGDGLVDGQELALVLGSYGRCPR